MSKPKRTVAAAAPATARVHARTWGERLVLWGVVAGTCAVPLAMNPLGSNPFGPLKAVVLAASAVSVAAGLALDVDLVATLIARARGSWIARIGAMLWVLVALSTVVSVDVRASMAGSYPEYNGVLAWLAASVIACGAASLPWPRALAIVGRALAASVTAMGIYALLQMFGLDVVSLSAGSAAGRVSSTLGNSSNAGVWLLLAIPLLVERLRRDPSRRWGTLAGIAAGLAAYMAVFTASRGAWAGLLSGALVWLIAEGARWERSRRLKAAGVALAVALALVVAVAVVPQLQKRVTSASAGTIAWRVSVWEATGQLALARPALGWGPNTFRYVFPEYRPSDRAVVRHLSRTAGDPHNLELSAAAALGIPGALALLALITAAGVASVAAIRARKDDDLAPVAVASALAGGLIALQFHYLTLDTLPLAAALLGMLIAARATIEPRAGCDSRVSGATAATVARVAAGVLAVVLAAALVAVTGLAAADVALARAYARAAAGEPWSSVAGDLGSAVALAPWEPTLRRATGRAATRYAAAGDAQAYEAGAAAFAAARSTSPRDLALRFDAAQLAMRYGMASSDADLVREARSELTALTGVDPNNPVYWYARGLSAAALKDYAEAISDIETAQRLSPRAAYRKALQQLRQLTDTP